MIQQIPSTTSLQPDNPFNLEDLTAFAVPSRTQSNLSGVPTQAYLLALMTSLNGLGYSRFFKLRNILLKEWIEVLCKAVADRQRAYGWTGSIGDREQRLAAAGLYGIESFSTSCQRWQPTNADDWQPRGNTRNR
jgi:hypothetical protein